MTELNLNKITAFVAVLGLIFGVYKFLQVQEIEAAKPYLKKKLLWCEKAVLTTSAIAVSDAGKPELEQEFWEMYWGVMGLVEKDEITQAMVSFGDALKAKKAVQRLDGKAEAIDIESRKDESESFDRVLINHPDYLGGKSLNIAHACRTELANDWSPSWAK